MGAELAGASAGLVASFCWALSSLYSARVVSRLGTPVFTTLRVSLGACILGFVANPILGEWEMPLRALFLISASSVVGIVIGESCLYAALRRLGPRLTLVLFSLNIPWVFIAESLLSGREISFLQAVCIGCICLGLHLSVKSRTPGSGEGDLANFRSGIAFGLVASLCQAAGVLLLAAGLTTFQEPLTASALRAIIASVFLWVGVAVFIGRESLCSLPVLKRDGLVKDFLVSAVLSSAAGLLFATLSVSLASPEVAAAATSLSPLLVLPLLTIVRRETVPSSAVAGAALGVGGLIALAAVK